MLYRLPCAHRIVHYFGENHFEKTKITFKRIILTNDQDHYTSREEDGTTKYVNE